MQMILLDGQSIAPAARRWLQESRVARILNLFDSVCNLVNDMGDVLALVLPGVRMGPFALSVRLEAGILPASGHVFTFTGQVTAVDRVSLFPEHLDLGRLVINLSQVAVWSPQPAWPRLGRERFCQWLPLLRQLLIQLAPAPEPVLLVRCSPEMERVPTLYEIRFREATTRVIAGLEEGADSLIGEGARALAGFGPGLTPSGDDWLVGASYALWAWMPGSRAASLTRIIAEQAVPRTTSLSGAWLKAAARGEADQAWHDLVHAMLDENETVFQSAAAEIIRTGHTSGADALAGFVTLGLQLTEGWHDDRSL